MAWSRTSRQSRGYGAAHDRMRSHLMATVILCEECKRSGISTPGTHADHIIPLAKGGTHDRSNYQLLCAAHSDAKTAADKGHKARKPIAMDGWPIG